MEKITIENEVLVKLEIRSVPLGYGYNAFERTLKVDFGLCKEKTETGICTDFELQLLKANIIQNANDIIEPPIVLLVKKEFVKAYQESFDMLHDMSIYLPSTNGFLKGIEKHLDDYVLIQYDAENSQLVDFVTSKFIPRKIHGRVSANEFYVDEELLSKKGISFEKAGSDYLLSFIPDIDTYEEYVSLPYSEKHDFIINFIGMPRKENQNVTC